MNGALLAAGAVKLFIGIGLGGLGVVLAWKLLSRLLGGEGKIEDNPAAGLLHGSARIALGLLVRQVLTDMRVGAPSLAAQTARAPAAALQVQGERELSLAVPLHGSQGIPARCSVPGLPPAIFKIAHHVPEPCVTWHALRRCALPVALRNSHNYVVSSNSHLTSESSPISHGQGGVPEDVDSDFFSLKSCHHDTTLSMP
jgi:hypothetical protein